MIAVIDYGMGNLRSVQKALEKAGAKAVVSQDESEIKAADKIVLPGVGAMKPAMEKLEQLGLIKCIKESASSGKPFLGICLGFQLLFENSDEGGSVKGLSLLKGNVKRFSSLKVPQIGWNQLTLKKDSCPLFKNIGDGANVYFCHSYYAYPGDSNDTATTTEYGIEYTSSIWRENVFGVQFHPEKSQNTGLKILQNFTELTQ